MAKAVGFTRESAARIADAVRTVEGMPIGPGGVGWYPYRADDGPRVLLGKTTAAWSKNNSATVDIYGGTPPTHTKTGTQAGVWNMFATSIASGKWVMIAQAENGNWYVISAEC